MNVERLATHRIWVLTVLTCLMLPVNTSRCGDEVEGKEQSGVSWKFDELPNIAAKTMGGKQFWTDEIVRGEWRIQKNCVTGHYRLLDDHGVRKTWGAWDHCKATWDELAEAGKLPTLKKKVVLVLHGLVRSRESMSGMAEFLAQDDEYSVLNLTYASTRVSIADHAAALQRIITHLGDVDEINFVAHSMGNLVIRHLIGDQLVEARGLGIDPRIKRIVMLAPPNGGAGIARRFRNNVVFRVIFGKSGQQLGKEWEDLEGRLAVPPCEFGIIAGGAGDENGRNPLLEGDDDMVVTVQETRLKGARDFVVVPAAHTFLMDNPKVRQYAKRFLEKGFFISEAERQPILGNEPAGSDEK
jgi:pimeloyl-ACP methyl ester carboxylesterase